MRRRIQQAALVVCLTAAITLGALWPITHWGSVSVGVDASEVRGFGPPIADPHVFYLRLWFSEGVLHMEFQSGEGLGGSFGGPLVEWYGGFVDWSEKDTIYWIAGIPLWEPILALSVYPTIAFIRGPVRRWRRRRKGWCIPCGYDLTGNVSGVCPECGSKA